MDIKNYLKYYKMIEDLKKDKTNVTFKLNGSGDKAYNVKLEGGKILNGETIEETSNNLKELLNRVYKNYNILKRKL